MEIPRALPLPTGVTDASPGKGLAMGYATGTQLAQTQQGLQQKQQEIDLEKQQKEVEKNIKMLEAGSKMILEGGDGAQAVGQTLVGKSYSFLTGQELPEGMPIDKPQAKDLSYAIGQFRKYQESGGAEGLNQNDAKELAIQSIATHGLKMRESEMAMLKETPMAKAADATMQPGMVGNTPVNYNPITGISTGQDGRPVRGQFTPAATVASTQAENQRKAIDENEKYKTSVTPFVNAHNNFVQMQKIANQAEKAGTSVDPWSFINAYVHTVDPSYNGVLTAQTYKDLRIAGSPIVSMIPGGETYLTSSKLDPNDAMRMLQIAKAQDKIYSKTASDYMDMTKRHIQSLGGDPAIVKDLLTQAPITKQLKSGRTAISDDGGLTWRPQ